MYLRRAVPGGVEEKRFVRFSFIKTQMTEALAIFGIFMRMETLKVGKPYGYIMEVPPRPTGNIGAPRLVTG